MIQIKGKTRLLNFPDAGYMSRTKWLLFASLLALITCANAASLHAQFDAGAYDLTTAELSLVDSDKPPVDSHWIPVDLPHKWGSLTSSHRSGWYRFALPDTPYKQVTAAYLWRFTMNASVWINDEFLGDGGHFGEPVARNWNRPFMFVLPSSAWKTKHNYLYLRLATYPGYGTLAPIVIGPYDVIRPDYEWRFMKQIIFNQAIFVISLFTALVMLTFWWADRTSSMYGIFSLSCICWAIYSLHMYIQDIPISAKHWWALVHSCIDWYGVFLALFAHRMLQVKAVIRERFLIGFGVTATVFYWSVDTLTMASYNNLFHIITTAIAVYVLILAVAAGIRHRTLDTGVFALGMSLVVLLALHDLSMNTMVAASLWRQQSFWLQYAVPILMIALLVVLARRFIMSTRNQVDAEIRIREERERIFSDIHDDVGSRVLSLVYSAESEAQADLARDALREIRSIVSGASTGSLENTDEKDGSLSQLLNEIHTEAEQRCTQAEIALEWLDKECDLSMRLSHTLCYHIQRIVRELLTNAIKHAGAGKITIVVASRNHMLTVIVRDYGDHNLSEFAIGSGMSGVARRAEELKGSVEWLEGNPGCEVMLEIPVTD